MTIRITAAACLLAIAVIRAGATHVSPLQAVPQSRGEVKHAFLPSRECLACHNGLTTPSGEDVSIGVAWRASMMANSSRDPYWQASVRREMIDHPAARAEIEHECANLPHADVEHRRAGCGA